jgi:oligosaccharide repeat unit polymerase
MVTNELTFYLAAAALLVLTIESCVKLLNGDSFSITLAVYVTVFGWYFVDPFLNPEQYNFIPSYLISQSYGQVLLFLIGFRFFMPLAERWIVPRRSTGLFHVQRFAPEQILIVTGVIWLLLLVIGITRMGGDVIGALFPIDSRAGATMWGRSAVATSAAGFLIASAGYLFNAITAFLGVLVFFQRNAFWRCLAGAMFVISLPYFLFEGARSHFLAVILPFIVTYLLYARQSLIIKLAVLAIAFFCLDHGFKLVTAFRGTGFRDLLAAEHPYELVDEDLRQSGLNMIQELCFANAYLASGSASPSYGGRYLNELLNVIPRAIWPSKPLVGIDYAKWRGLEDSQSDLGVSATISTGMIGGGLLNFGPFFGPVAAGIIMALWTALLIRWWQQRNSLLRLMLFMLGAGLTFNLGRDITLLVLWPVVFSYCFVRLIEIWTAKQPHAAPQVTTQTPAFATVNLQSAGASSGRLRQSPPCSQT